MEGLKEASVGAKYWLTREDGVIHFKGITISLMELEQLVDLATSFDKDWKEIAYQQWCEMVKARNKEV